LRQKKRKMTFVHSTNVYAWKERLFGKPGFKPSRLSIYDNGRILWEKDVGESGKQKGWANLSEIFPHIRIGVLNNEAKKERASDEGLILAYHTLILPLEISKPTAGVQERDFAVAFEREIYDWMQAFARVSNTGDRFHEIVRKYRLRKKYNVYSGSSHYGLSQIASGGNDQLLDAAADESQEADGGDLARLWSAAHGASEDFVAIWTTYQEQALIDLAATRSISNGNGYSCVKCWKVEN